MAYLSYPSPMGLQLRLDAQEGAILAVIRGCSWWTGAEFEGHVPGSSMVSSVTLSAERCMDSTLRRILQMSFGLVFPKEGGLGQSSVREEAQGVKRKRAAKK
jgi:hypothetical protein